MNRFKLITLNILNRLGTPLLLGALLQYFKPKPTTTYEAALIFAGGISIANIINAITINQTIFGSFHIGGRIRVAICSIVYRKVFRRCIILIFTNFK